MLVSGRELNGYLQGYIRMDIQRLRNLTTGIMHTEIDHVYEDLGFLTGEKELMTHMLPRVMRAVEPWLREQIKEERFWNGKWDTEHVGEVELPEPTKEDKEAFLNRFAAMPHPFYKD